VLFSRPDRVRRQWFNDARYNGRRMEVTSHPDEGLPIVSLWHGAFCRATFQLPVDSAPQLIETLVASLDDETPSHPSGATVVR
jgi:hypothetical protein